MLVPAMSFPTANPIRFAINPAHACAAQYNASAVQSLYQQYSFGQHSTDFVPAVMLPSAPHGSAKSTSSPTLQHAVRRVSTRGIKVQVQAQYRAVQTAGTKRSTTDSQYAQYKTAAAMTRRYAQKKCTV
eukprot:2470478-Rhodomonas_salina.1